MITRCDRNPANPLRRSPAPAGRPIIDPRRSRIIQGHRTPIDHLGTGLIVVIGYLLWKDTADTGTVDEGDDDIADEDEAPYAASLTAPTGRGTGRIVRRIGEQPDTWGSMAGDP